MKEKQKSKKKKRKEIILMKGGKRKISIPKTFMEIESTDKCKN